MPSVLKEPLLSRSDAQNRIKTIGNTPVVLITVRSIFGTTRRIFLKLEGENPGGSLKDRTASSLFSSVADHNNANFGGIIESTSGNLGVGLALQACAAGVPFTAVVDRKATTQNIDKMRRYGAKIDMISGDESIRSLLQQRIDRVAELMANDKSLAWTNQYSNLANPKAHETGTAPELLSQLRGNLDAVFVATSTGGTLTGVGRHMRRQSPHTKVMAVDAFGSTIFGDNSAPRLLVGIGASRKSHFIDSSVYDEYTVITDAEAFATSIALKLQTGISIGGSAGAVLLAACRYAESVPANHVVACVCADSGDNYVNEFFDRQWLIDHGLEHQLIPYDFSS